MSEIKDTVFLLVAVKLCFYFELRRQLAESAFSIATQQYFVFSIQISHKMLAADALTEQFTSQRKQLLSPEFFILFFPFFLCVLSQYKTF